MNYRPCPLSEFQTSPLIRYSMYPKIITFRKLGRLNQRLFIIDVSNFFIFLPPPPPPTSLLCHTILLTPLFSYKNSSPNPNLCDVFKNLPYDSPKLKIGTALSTNWFIKKYTLKNSANPSSSISSWFSPCRRQPGKWRKSE